MPLHPYSPSKSPLQPLHLVEEINHRVVNEFAEAIASLSLAARRAANTSDRAALSRAASRLRAHAAAHRALLAPTAVGLMDLGEYAARLCASLSSATLAEMGVWLAVETDEVWMDAARCWRVGLIIAELVRNAARHGRIGGAESIRVEITKAADEVTCTVHDDGCARPAPSPGRGQGVVQAIAAELDGEVEWSFTPQGCLARLRFPAPS